VAVPLAVHPGDNSDLLRAYGHIPLANWVEAEFLPLRIEYISKHSALAHALAEIQILAIKFSLNFECQNCASAWAQVE
jgi:hypothetical protein